jgi:hypothetical protein
MNLTLHIRYSIEHVLLNQIRAADQAAAERSFEALGPSTAKVKVDAFVEQFSAVGPLDHYRLVPKPAEVMVAVLAEGIGTASVTPFLQAALASGIVHSIDSGALSTLPTRVQGHQLRQFQRIVDSLYPSGSTLSLGQDLFLKDMGLVSLRLLAAAAQLIDVRCGIPRSLLTRQRWQEAATGVLEFAKLGGFKPYMQIHTHDSYLDEFTEEGWAECYRCCADLCESRPALRGMFGSSWFYDPAVLGISPRLSYLQSVPSQGGASLWYYSTGGDSIANATATSPSRRKLYEEGRYMPKSFMMVWGRDALIEWAGVNPVNNVPLRTQ